MRWIFLILFFLTSLLIQIEMPAFFCGFPVTVELLFVAVIYFALHDGARRGLLLGIFAGAVQDGASFTPFGLNLFGFAILGAVAGSLRRVLFIQKLSTRLVFILIFTLLLQFSRYLFFVWRGESLPPAPQFFAALCLLLFWNALAALIFWPVMQWSGILRPPEEDRETSSAEFFNRFRRRLGKKILSSDKKVLSWK